MPDKEEEGKTTKGKGKSEVIKLVRIERTGEEVFTGITILRSGGIIDHWSADENLKEFEVDVETAMAAIRTKGFKVKDNSPVKLKTT